MISNPALKDHLIAGSTKMLPLQTSEAAMYGAGIAIGILLLAQLITWVLVKRNPERNYTELKLRLKTWWLIIGVFTAAIAFNRATSALVFCFISFLAFKEFLTLAPWRRTDYPVLFFAYLAIPIQYYWVSIGWYGMFIIWIPVYVFLFLPMCMMWIGETKGFLGAAGTLHWGLMTTVFSLSHMAFLLALPDKSETAAGDSLVFFLIFLTQLNDVAQFVWGKNIGRTKVVPKVSPNKTLEGLLGGVATTTVVSWALAPYFTPLTAIESLACGMLIGVTGFVGDVVMSSVKRDIGVKDSGNLLPGHGGILDRLDSLTFTAPLFFHFVRYFHY